VDDPASPPTGIPPADTLRWAVIGPHTDEQMAAEGLRRVRTLVELRRPLPLEPEMLAAVPRIPVRAFQPGVDEAGFLAVNNAAFHWHPEQGGWDLERLDRELSKDWVDLDDFLVHEDPLGAIDGYCWTRHHPSDDLTAADGDPDVGEIWAIAASPDRHGSGLGTALVVEGIRHLTLAGLPVVILYTEETNEAARAMYDKLGFVLHERRGGYR
jgi:mycothiol synthase